MNQDNQQNSYGVGKQLGRNICIMAAVIGLAAVFVTAMTIASGDPKGGRSKVARTMAASAGPGAHEAEGTSKAEPRKPEAEAPKPPIPGFELSRLKYTTALLTGHWEEEDVFENDRESWFGSTCIVNALDGSLLLVTNLHCLGLEGIYHADDDGSPELINYSLEVHFPNGVSKKVTELGLLKGTADLAWLIVDAKGVEFEALGKLLDIPALDVGTDVVVVGSPADPALRGTYTFGKVSAIRSTPEEDGREITYIQTDAAINHGNSGGPMFAKVGDRYVWVGIATAKMEGAESLGLAIEVHELQKRELLGWIDATPQGISSFFIHGKAN